MDVLDDTGSGHMSEEQGVSVAPQERWQMLLRTTLAFESAEYFDAALHPGHNYTLADTRCC